MSKDPAMMLYTSDFLTGTMLMTNEQVGKYIRLLCYEHQHGRMREKDMLIICSTYDEDIFCKFKTDDTGLYYKHRLEEEQNKRIAYSESRKANRTIKKEPYDDDMKNTCKTYDKHMDNEIDNEDDIDNVTKLPKTKVPKPEAEQKPYQEIIDYLNQKAGTSFRYTSSKTQSLIDARLNDKYTVDDFITVINKKTEEWIDSDMAKFLRPETLFSPKFESYLNQLKCNTSKSTYPNKPTPNILKPIPDYSLGESTAERWAREDREKAEREKEAAK